jgi:hypothetical protein
MFLSIYVSIIGICFRAMAEYNWPFDEVPQSWWNSTCLLLTGGCFGIWGICAVTAVFIRAESTVRSVASKRKKHSKSPHGPSEAELESGMAK